ncbi:OmpA family protein [Isoalcanivorax indicus]|uniref:OmpA family protein n=1 Tax=Isoalcanivorax indicus TaxID=2202653 RepID=UPI000DBA30AC|nr:OmpA family protein [Isoalcanivorax indicus]
MTRVINGMVRWWCPVIITAVAITSTIAAASEPGQDNPLVSRFAGATMQGYMARDYDEVALPLGPIPMDAYHLRSGWNQEVLQPLQAVLEGRVTWLTYEAPAGRSPLEIQRNYQAALAADGFNVRFECAGQTGCGRQIGAYVRNVTFPDDYWRNMRNALHPTILVRGGTRALLAERDNDAGRTHVFLYIQDQQAAPVIHKVVVEGQAMQTGQVQTGARSADELSASLTADGYAVVDGIFFDHDSAALRPESMEALTQMARLLETQPDIRVLVVGHTDNQGSFDYNADLSLRRASAVRQSLVGDFGIAADRMTPKGASFMAPRASNASEAGREQNRRVELVLQ